MLYLNPGFRDKLLDTLLEIPALNAQDNRNVLLRNLPPIPANSISRSNSPITDLNNITSAVESWGILDSGEWALVVLAKNALRFVKGTQQGRTLESMLAELETLAVTQTISPISKELIEEALIWQLDERLPTCFLEKGHIASRAVAKLLVQPVLAGKIQSHSLVSGTGWLITQNLLLTNYHVIEARNRRKEPPADESDFEAQALNMKVWFNYDNEEQKHTEYKCIDLVHYNYKLDYALLRLASESTTYPKIPLEQWGYLSVIEKQPILQMGIRLNIIQHPQGGYKCIAIRNNFYIDSLSTNSYPNRIRYLTDTEPGSSGSPVFNDSWQVIALHHASIKVEEAQYKGEIIKYNNQGIEIHAIIEDCPSIVQEEIYKLDTR